MCGRYAMGISGDEIEYELENIFGGNQAAASGGEEDDDEQEEAAHERRIAALRGGGNGKGKGKGRRQEETPRVQWDVGAKANFRPRYNVAPTTQCVVVIRKGALEGASTVLTNETEEAVYQINLMKWGLIPSWTKEPPTTPLHTINARIETILSPKSMWTQLRDKKRCLVVSQGFYEWLAKGKQKLPHLVKMTKDEEGKERVMVMAGMWDHCDFKRNFEPLTSFTIVTVPSNKQLNFLHDRMPALLSSPSDIALWLSDAPWSPRIESLLRPFADKLDVYPVSLEVGKVSADDPSFILPLSEKKGTISSFFSAQAAKASPSSSPIKASPKKSTSVASAATKTAPTSSSSSASASKASAKATSAATSASTKHPRADAVDIGSPLKKCKVVKTGTKGLKNEAKAGESDDDDIIIVS